MLCDYCTRCIIQHTEGINCNIHNMKLMETQMQASSSIEHRKSAPRSQNRGWRWFLLITGLLLIAGFFQVHPPEFTGIPSKHLYKPGDNVGFYIGVVGGLMMLTLLIYPLRKRIGF